jgi:L-rhamnose isomerase
MTELQNANNWTEILVRSEELKTLPFGDVWEEYCVQCGAPVDGAWFATVKAYEEEVLVKRV